MYICMYVCMGFMVIMTAMVLHARPDDSLILVSVRGVHDVFSTAGFKGGGKPRQISLLLDLFAVCFNVNVTHGCDFGKL